MSLMRTALGHWIVAGDGGVSRLVQQANSFEYPDNLITLSRVAHLIPEGGVVVDAGASIGDQAVMYSQIVGREGHVYAFEPQSDSYRALDKNTFRLRNVTPRCLALGASRYPCRLSISPTNLGASFLGTDDRYPDFQTEWAQVTTLDSELPDVKCLDFIHLDAEGMEPQILEGAGTLIAKFHPVLLIEVTGQWLERYGSSKQQLYDQLDRLGYPTVIPMGPNPYWYDVLALPVGKTLEQEVSVAG